MSVPGRKRKLTDEQVRRVRQWKSLAHLAREVGVSPRMAEEIRKGYQFKQPSP